MHYFVETMHDKRIRQSRAPESSRTKYQKYIPSKKKDIQIYPNIYKIHTRYQAAAMRRQPGTAPSRGPESGPGGSGPGRAAAAWYFVYFFILHICVCTCMHLDISGVVVFGVVRKFKNYYSKSYVLDLVDIRFCFQLVQYFTSCLLLGRGWVGHRRAKE